MKVFVLLLLFILALGCAEAIASLAASMTIGAVCIIATISMCILGAIVVALERRWDK